MQDIKQQETLAMVLKEIEGMIKQYDSERVARYLTNKSKISPNEAVVDIINLVKNYKLNKQL